MITGSLESAGAVIIGVSASLFLIMVIGAIVFYLYSLINNLAIKSVVTHERFLVELICIAAIALGVITLLHTAITLIVVSLLAFVGAYIATKLKKGEV